MYAFQAPPTISGDTLSKAMMGLEMMNFTPPFLAKRNIKEPLIRPILFTAFA
jgi:hypothetical protein